MARKIDTHFMIPFQAALDLVKDSDAGQIFKALNRYRVNCKREVMKKASLQFLYDTYCDAIDEDRKLYLDVCNKNAENVKKRWDKTPPQATSSPIESSPINNNNKNEVNVVDALNKQKSFSEQAKADSVWLERICMNAHIAYKIDKTKVIEAIDIFANIAAVETAPPLSYSDFKIRFRQYLDSHGKSLKNQQNATNTENIRSNKTGFINACETIDQIPCDIDFRQSGF